MAEVHLPIAGNSELERELGTRVRGEVLFDAYTRHIYSTDASMYAIEPVGVVYPIDSADVAATVRIAAERGAAVLPRGAGTSLNGQAEGAAIVLDFSRHMDAILEIDPERRIARVQPGVVQDDLNRAVAEHGLLFAPDTSTGNRATIGGMIGNNSCGSRSARYGMTIDHVQSLRVVLADGSEAPLEALEPAEILRRAEASTLEGSLYREIPALVERGADVIRRAVPGHWRRSGGYRLERLLPEAGPLNLAHVVVGSEGTLAIAVEATLRLVPKPTAVAAVVGHFHSIDDAVAASHPAMESGATTVELVDKMILDLARTSPIHRHLAEHIDGDPGAILWVEFYAGSAEEAEAGMRRLEERWSEEGHGYSVVAAPTPAEQRGFRELRKAGLGLLMNAGRGRERSLAFVEDTAVDPAHLSEFTRRFAKILDAEGLRAGFYGHASAGTLHIRPFMDLTRPGEVDKMRSVAERVFELVVEFGGVNSSEHGDGLARSEFNRRFFGDEFYELMLSVKRTFDPGGILNPGKKVEAPSMTDSLREPAMPDGGPLETRFRFGADGMRGAANRCMRIGACRKSASAGGAMCPSYMATREEEHSTRGRANALVRALSSPNPEIELADPRLHEILDLCLECKACQRECPLSVDMATLKSEALYHQHRRNGTPLRSRVFGNIRSLNRLGSAFAPVSNWPTSLGVVRALLDRFVGIDRRRPIPPFQRETLPKWFRRRGPVRGQASPRGHLAFLADSFASFTEPEIGRAAIELLEAAGWEVELVSDVCCGRAFISKGLLDEAQARHRALMARLGPIARAGIPIVGCEPSCVLTLKDELPALASAGDPDAAAVAREARLADDLIADALDEGWIRLQAPEGSGARVLFHGHCHQKAAGATEGTTRMLSHLPGVDLEVLDAGCCGMAGSFGFEREHFDLSMRIGGMRLFPAVEGLEENGRVCATGVSCRQQIHQGTGRRAEHPIRLVREQAQIP